MIRVWACSADLAGIRGNVLGWGFSASVPDFEKYVRAYCGVLASSSSVAVSSSSNDAILSSSSGVLSSSSGDAELSSSSSVVSSSSSEASIVSSSSSVALPSSSSVFSSSSFAAVSSSSACTLWDWVKTTAPTCEEAGVETKTCTGNPSITDGTREITPLTWIYSVTTPATCESTGVETMTCPGNASSAQTRQIARLTWIYSVTTPATCDAPGVETMTCPDNASTAQTRPIAQVAYDNETQFCHNGKVGNFCGSRTETFDPDLYECRTGDKIYLKNPVYYEGEYYDAVLIGTQTWTAKNLNYNASDSKCYNNQDSYCTQYGRLYDWATAMGISSSYNSNSYNPSSSTKYRGVCPQGWHIPNDAEWDALMTAVGGSSTAGTKLKAISGWNSSGIGGGTDIYGFSALPGGNGNSDGTFNPVGNSGSWWSASEFDSEFDSDIAYSRYMGYGYESASLDYNYKDLLCSVRCLQD
ncbi:hypothetical protein R83H12_02327 [Fibrobacteria bacterium R8-3-H12]